MPGSEYDALIIGAGAGGSVAATRLAIAGWKVAVLERGPRFDPARDYHLDEREWEFKDPFIPHIPDTCNALPSHPPSGFDHLRTTLEPSPALRAFQYGRACGVGGSTLRYQGEAHRFPPYAFSMKSRYGMDVDWPLTYEELEPYYAEMEILLGVAGEFHPLFPRSVPYPNPPHPLSPASRRIASGCSRMGLHLLPNTLAILSRPYGNRLACTYCKMCSLGCMVGDKSSADVAILPAGEKTGRLHVRTETVAKRLILDKRGRVSSVLAVDTTSGQESLFRADVVILSAGAIETPRLLLHSAQSGFPQGLANRSGLVGKNLMENLYFGALFLFDEKIETYKGVPIDSKVLDFARPDPDRGFPRGFTISSLGAPDYLQGPAAFALWIAPGFGRDHRRFVERHYGAHAMICGVAEQSPREVNRLTLDRKERDPWGVPKAWVDMRLNIEDCTLLELMRDQCSQILDATKGTTLLGQYSAYDISRASHAAGTARMGTHEEDSVVDAFCRTHDIQNLYIMDGSVLPTQGCGFSPSLTIQALALRAAEQLVSSHGA